MRLVPPEHAAIELRLPGAPSFLAPLPVYITTTINDNCYAELAREERYDAAQ
jgi:hypothetical protein